MKYLLLDDAVIERKAGVTRRWHRPDKHPRPILEPEHPREGRRLFLRLPPLYDAERGVWRMWYRGGPEALPLLAESADGLAWTRPRLGLVEHDGSTDNNVIDIGFTPRTPKENSLTPIRVPDPDDPHPFKALVRIEHRLYPQLSQDGLRWQRVEGEGPPSGDAFTLNYDDLERRYVAAGKLPYGGRYPVGYYKRTVGISTSQDLQTWTEPRMVLHGDELDHALGVERVEALTADPAYRTPVIRKPEEYRTDIYYMPIFTYEGLYVALPVVFNQTGRYYLTGPRWNGLYINEDGYLHTQLAVSRDLFHWQRPNREPFLDISPVADPHLYDDAGVYCAPPVRRDGRLWFYYVGRRFTHLKHEVLEVAYGPEQADVPQMSIFLARLREDGFVSLAAGAEDGFMLTRPLAVEGSRLMVNADAAGGVLRAELIDARTGRVLPGYAATDCRPRYCWRFDEDLELEDSSVPFGEDALAGRLRWRDGGDLAALKGKEIRIRFFLREAELYAFWFADGDA